MIAGCRPGLRDIAVNDQSEVGAVAQQVEQRTTTEPQAAGGPAIAERTLRADTAFVEAALQRMDRAQFEVGLENVTHRLGFRHVGHQRTAGGDR